jgi:ferritin
MDKLKALEEILKVLKDTENNIESILNELWDEAYEKGKEDGDSGGW